MRRGVILIFLFISVFIHCGIPSDNIVKIRIMVDSIEYVSYVVISSKINPNLFSIVREDLW